METGTLHVTVVEGVDLLPSSKRKSAYLRKNSTRKSKGYGGPCIILQVASHIVATECVLFSSSCTWHEDFLFEDALIEDELRITCVDRVKSSLGKSATTSSSSGETTTNVDGFIGEVSIPISRLPEDEKIEQWYQLLSKDPEKLTLRSAIKLILKYVPHRSPDPLLPLVVTTIEKENYSLESTTCAPLQHVMEEIEKTLPGGIADYIVVVGPKKLCKQEFDKQYYDTNLEQEDHPPPKSTTHHHHHHHHHHQEQPYGHESEASVLHRYPLQDKEGFPLPTKIEWFCFPGGLECIASETQPETESFTFVLVGGVGGLIRSFGICQTTYILDPKLPGTWIPVCVCLVSRLPLLGCLRNSLTLLHSLWISQKKQSSVEDYIVQLTEEIPMPIPGAMDVKFTIQDKPFCCSLPRIGDLPVLPFSLSTLFECFSISNVIRLFSCVACECRIVFHSKHLLRLSTIAESLCSLLYPFRWQHPYVPILPKVLSEYVQAPLPFILGVHSDWLQDILDVAPEFVLIVDIDRGVIEGRDDLPILPMEQSQRLHNQIHTLLFPQKALDEESSLNDVDKSNFTQLIESVESVESVESEIRFEFLYYITELLDGYRDCLFFVDEKLPVFNRNRFLKIHVKPETIPFLTRIFATQDVISKSIELHI